MAISKQGLSNIERESRPAWLMVKCKCGAGSGCSCRRVRIIGHRLVYNIAEIMKSSGHTT